MKDSRLKVARMPLEQWKEILDWISVGLVGLTFAAGAAALIVGKILNDHQEAQLRKFDKDLTDTKLELASSQKAAADAQLALRKASTLAAQSRRIILGSRNGDEEIREGRFKELEKYADTPAVIVFVRDEEAEILAHDIRSALLKVGWKSVVITDLASTPIPLGYIENGVQVRTLIREHAPPPGSPQRNIDPPAVATAIVNLLKLDLGQEATGMPFGVTYSPEWVIDGRAIGILRYGFKFPENGVVITVGHKPIEQLFWFLPDPAPPAHK